MASRGVGAALAIAAAGLLAASALGKGWISAGSASVGLMGGEICRDGTCKSLELPEKDGWRTTGTVAFAAALGAAGLGLVAGIMGLARKRSKVPAVLTLVAALAALGGGIAFILVAPGKDVMEHLAWGTYCGVGGGVFALVGAILLMRAAGAGPNYAVGMPGVAGPAARTLMLAETAKVAGPEAKTMAPGMAMAPQAQAPRPSKGAPAMVPPCPKCHGPLQFAGQFNAWYCPRCQSYLQV